jgi:hypothetical protein
MFGTGVGKSQKKGKNKDKATKTLQESLDALRADPKGKLHVMLAMKAACSLNLTITLSLLALFAHSWFVSHHGRLLLRFSKATGHGLVRQFAWLLQSTIGKACCQLPENPCRHLTSDG